MHDYIDNLTINLRLTPYQSHVLKANHKKYNMGRLVKRGGVIYAPYINHGIYGRVLKFLYGARADLIGQNKILVQNRRNIKFMSQGFYCVKIGPYTYYADAMGRAISREVFLDGIKN